MAGEKKISFQPPLIFFKNTWHIWSSLGGGGGECLTAGRCGMVIFIFKMSFLNSFIALTIFHYVIYIWIWNENTLCYIPMSINSDNLHWNLFLICTYMFWMIVWLQQCSYYCYIIQYSLTIWNINANALTLIFSKYGNIKILLVTRSNDL